MHARERELKRLTRWALITVLGWTLLIGGSLISTIRNEESVALTLARNTARANFLKDQAFRLWASRKGGLYAPVKANTQPSPYMAHLAERDIETRGGDRFTLLNPATMLREMMEQFPDLYGIKGRIVGIVTLNPDNRADAWEEQAIHAFERGEKEIVNVADIAGVPHLRLVRPMLMQADCVKCHGHLGFKIGDVRGAVDISVPMTEFYAVANTRMRQSALSHGGVWLVGLLGGGAFFRSQRRRLEALMRTEEALRASEMRWQFALEGAGAGVWDWNIVSNDLYLAPGWKQLLGYRDDELPNAFDTWESRLHPEDHAQVMASMRDYLEGFRADYDVEFRLRARNGAYLWIRARGRIVERDADGAPLRMIGIHDDISGRKRDEAHLLAFRALAEASVDAILMADPATTRLSFANRAAHEIFACDFQRQEMVGLQGSMFWPADDRAAMEDAIGAGLAGGWRGDVRLLRRDGTQFDASITIFPIRNDKGEVSSLVGIVRDISERKLADVALKTANAKLERVIDFLPDATFVVDTEGRVIAWNRAMEAMTGVAKADMIGNADGGYALAFYGRRRPMLIDLVLNPGDEGNTLYTSFQRSGEALIAEGETPAVWGGRGAFVWATALPLRDAKGDVIGAIECVRDVTEQKRAEAALRLTQFGVERSADAVFVIAPDNRFLDVNAAACASLGYDKSELLALGIKDIDPDVTDEALAGMNENLKSGERMRFETRHRRKDGTLFPVEIMANYIKFGGREYNFCFVRDITERKAAEAALKELNATLEARVREEVASNRDKDHLLIQQSRLAAMGEMMGNIAHQWRQPINALSLVLANLKDAFEYGQLDQAYLDGQVERSTHLINKMSTTIDDFRNFFRPDRTPQPFSLVKAVRDAMLVVELNYVHANIGLELDSDEEVVCQGLPNEYAQVVLNLLGNAKDAIQDRGVKNGRVIVRVERVGREGRVTVADNGGGIPEAVLPKVFDPYFTTREKGTGIGLYMSRMIIENMGGHIEVGNAGGGASVMLTSPLAAEAALPAQAGRRA